MLLNILKSRKNYHLTKVINTLTANSYIILITPDSFLLQNITTKFSFLQIKANLMRVFLKKFLHFPKQLFDLRALIRTNIYYFPFKEFDLLTFLQFPMSLHLGMLYLYKHNIYYFKYKDLVLFKNLNCAFFFNFFSSNKQLFVIFDFLSFFFLIIFFFVFIFSFSFFIFFPFFCTILYC